MQSSTNTETFNTLMSHACGWLPIINENVCCFKEKTRFVDCKYYILHHYTASWTPLYPRNASSIITVHWLKYFIIVKHGYDKQID